MKAKKLLPILLSIGMVFSSITPAFADEVIYEETSLQTEATSLIEDNESQTLNDSNVEISEEGLITAEDNVPSEDSSSTDIPLEEGTSTDITPVEKSSSDIDSNEVVIPNLTARPHIDGQVNIPAESVSDYPEGDSVTEDGSDVSLPSQYDPREILMDTRNQGDYNTCWSHALVATAEAYAIKMGLASRDVRYSVKQLCYFVCGKYVPDALGNMANDSSLLTPIEDSNGKEVINWFDSGFYGKIALRSMANWIGIADDSVAPISEAPIIKKNDEYNFDYYIDERPLDESLARKDVLHLREFHEINWNDRDEIKKAIMESYMVECAVEMRGEFISYEYSSIYHSDEQSDADRIELANHEVTIVGWDDDFPADHFTKDDEVNLAPGNGAWLVRNTWAVGNSIDIASYYWLSYYDNSLCDIYQCIYDKADNYENLYAYDGSWFYDYISNKDKIEVSNVFETKACENGELLKAVSFYTGNTNVNYTIDIYINPNDNNPRSGILVDTITGFEKLSGYKTLDLEKPIKLAKGDKYSVVVTLEKKGKDVNYEIEMDCITDLASSVANAVPGQSFLFDENTNEWIDIATADEYEKYGNFRIKAFTDNSSEYIAKASGWQLINNKWYYINTNGSLQTGWLKYNNKWYYLNPNGEMQTGWIKNNSKWYYLNPNGDMATGWVKYNNKWYYLNPNGDMATGWKKVSGKWYYLNPSGAMHTGWVKSNNKWYYLNSNGAMHTGWLKVNGKQYYLKSNGDMVTGWIRFGNVAYYFNQNGELRKIR